MEAAAAKSERIFNGQKLKEARELRGMDLTQLSYQTGISRQGLASYENGYYMPKPENLLLLSRVLKVKWDFFMLPTQTVEHPTFFRSINAATKRVRLSALRTLDMMEHVVNAVGYFLPLQELNLPDINIQNPELLTREEIETYALQCREHFGFGLDPIEDLTGHLELNGIVIYMSDAESDALDAFSRWNSDYTRPFVHLNSRKECAVRSRFDLAHELAHMIFHRSVDKNDLRYQKYFKDFEAQANYFASAFLLPEQSFSGELPNLSLSVFLSLKKRWGVSVGAMIKRCEHLGYIDEGDKSFWINYSHRGWRRKEPLDDEIPVEKPIWINEAIKSLIEKNEATASEILSRIPYDNDFIAQFLGLDILRQNVQSDNVSDLIRKNILDHLAISNNGGKVTANIISAK